MVLPRSIDPVGSEQVRLLGRPHGAGKEIPFAVVVESGRVDQFRILHQKRFQFPLKRETGCAIELNRRVFATLRNHEKFAIVGKHMGVGEMVWLIENHDRFPDGALVVDFKAG